VLRLLGDVRTAAVSTGPLHVQQATAALAQLSTHRLAYRVEIGLCVVRLVEGNVTPKSVFVHIDVTLYVIAEMRVNHAVFVSDQTYSGSGIALRRAIRRPTTDSNILGVATVVVSLGVCRT